MSGGKQGWGRGESGEGGCLNCSDFNQGGKNSGIGASGWISGVI